MKAALEEPVTRGGIIARDEKGRIVATTGRRKGAKDKGPRVGSIRAVFTDYIENFQGHDLMLDAVDRGIQAYDPGTALGYLNLGAKVLDRTEDGQQRPITINVVTNVDFNKLRDARAQARVLPQ